MYAYQRTSNFVNMHSYAYKSSIHKELYNHGNDSSDYDSSDNEDAHNYYHQDCEDQVGDYEDEVGKLSSPMSNGLILWPNIGMVISGF